ncbi:DUF4446 family protein [Brevibacillus fulvus]|uniref:DUF4446 domain-containing protein n=1 Tax=Brevibacillus fulvus TaxID=1125967 RepID=A0A938XX32_9BACL|nr:DUF4446 family protein [Brevibacillus fulvus]MBM7589280.1 hypothetical protein [Brevibacillus fulvus]
MQFLSLNTTPVLIGGLLLLNLILLILVIAQSVRVGRVRKSLKRLFTGVDSGNLETKLDLILNELGAVREKQADQQFQLNRLSQKLSDQYGRLAIRRYNAFGEQGSDLSFSLALLDEQQNGVVLTSIYGREESRMYAKPVQAGKSMYNLSEEEQAVIKLAATQKGS